VLYQLSNTKTQDGKQTLIHFLVGSIEKRFPDAMDFASELLHVEKAARGEMPTSLACCVCFAFHLTKTVFCSYVVKLASVAVYFVQAVPVA